MNDWRASLHTLPSSGSRMSGPGDAPTPPALPDSWLGGTEMADTSQPPLYVVDPESGCWVWNRYRDSNGYGRAYDGERQDWAHRVYYRRYKGSIPAGYEIDHTCQNPPCVNPAHLDAVTKVEHCRRTMARLGKDDLHARAAYLRQMHLTYDEIAQVLGYAGKASAHSAVLSAIAKGLVNADDVPPGPNLSEAEREEIRDLYALGIPQTELGRWYGVDSSNISRTITGRRGRRSA